MRWIALLAAATLGCLGGSSLHLSDDGQEVPPAVQAALARLAGAQPLDELEVEEQDGRTVWEAEWSVDGVEHEAELLADGTVLEHEYAVPVAAVPAAVRAAAERGLGSDDVAYEVCMVTLYEAEVGDRELLLLPDGEVLEDEAGDGEGADED